MRKFFILILIPAILIGCTGNDLSLQNKNKCTYEEKDNYKMIASILNKNIFLYGKKGETRYFDIKLKIGENYKTFDWTNTLNIGNYPPKLILSDINNDGINELIIILIEGYGTGIHIEAIKILNINTMDQINTVDTIDTIDKNVKSKLTRQNVRIKIGEKVYLLKTNDYTSNIKNLFSNIEYGSEIYFSIKNNKIQAKVSAQITPGAYIGYFVIEYKYQGNQLVVDNIIFDANKVTK